MNNRETEDIPIITKRLELIKNFIALEEDDEILCQVNKLKNFHLNKAVQNILNSLQQKSYGKAIKDIEEFIDSQKQVNLYIDPEIEALHFEAKSLEKQIQELSNEKVELDKLIHEFSVRHNNELGELILKILEFRKEKSKGTSLQEETEKDFVNFYNNYEAAKAEEIAILNEEEFKELKDKYRKASKLCHPDVVDEDQKDIAHKIFMELNEAYEKNDLKKVTEILEQLLQGKAAIKSSETFIKISAITNWNEYFENTKQNLQEQLKQVSNGRK